MNITGLVPWFGAKRAMAARIVAEIGEHAVYWEPFCGSLAVLLSKPPARMETAIDMHGDLVNLALVLSGRDTAERLYAELRPMLPSNVLHEEAKRRLTDYCEDTTSYPNVARAADFFVASWLGRNGTIGTKMTNNNFCVRYTSNGGAPAKRWQAAVDAIPDWHDRLRNVVILRTDAIKALDRIEDKAGTAIYCDPPYLAKGATYEHDFAAADHDRLAASLQRFNLTRVVVSYYEHPRLAELYPGWRKVEVPVTKVMVNQGARATGDEPVKAPEVLLVNQPASGSS